VTRASLREYAAVQRERYQPASRGDKRRLLDEMVAVTGMHRKAAIRLLRRTPRSAPGLGRAGRPRRYGAEVAAAAEVLWQGIPPSLPLSRRPLLEPPRPELR
jgi:hypothetical protein